VKARREDICIPIVKQDSGTSEICGRWGKRGGMVGSEGEGH
jgi:hypothetical protein